VISARGLGSGIMIMVPTAMSAENTAVTARITLALGLGSAAGAGPATLLPMAGGPSLLL
jgi:hypothetical protein